MNKIITLALAAAVLAGCGQAPLTRPQATPGAVAAKYDPEVAAAKTEIKRHLQADGDVRVVTLSVTRSPLGTVFTFRATVTEGEDRFEVTGAYNVLDGEVRISKKTAV